MLTGDRVWEQPWPAADPALLERDIVVVAVQVNGKLRDRIEAPPDASREQLESLARERPNVARHLDGHEVAKVVVVPGPARQLRRALRSARAAAAGVDRRRRPAVTAAPDPPTPGRSPRPRRRARRWRRRAAGWSAVGSAA